MEFLKVVESTFWKKNATFHKLRRSTLEKIGSFTQRASEWGGYKEKRPHYAMMMTMMTMMMIVMMIMTMIMIYMMIMTIVIMMVMMIVIMTNQGNGRA